MDFKNCSPTIKTQAVIYIANYKINNDESPYNNTPIYNIKILKKFITEYDSHFTDKIIHSLKTYIYKNFERIQIKIIKIITDKSAMEINERYCDICDLHFYKKKELQKHKLLSEHLSKENKKLNEYITILESDKNKITQQLKIKEDRCNKLLIDLNVLQSKYDTLNLSNIILQNKINLLENKQN